MLVCDLVAYHVRTFSLNVSEAPKYTPNVRYQQDVSAATVQEWEKELLEDPKVDRVLYDLDQSHILIVLLEPPRSRRS